MASLREGTHSPLSFRICIEGILLQGGICHMPSSASAGHGYPVLLLCLLLAFPAWSVRGASEGLLLWFNVVLPTLAPFLICTQLVMTPRGVQWITRPFYRIVRQVFQLSRPGTCVLICGLLCGYPLGAKLCADFVTRGDITRQEARYLMSICNHPSPMFLLGYVRAQLPSAVPAWYLLACLYLPILPVSVLARACYPQEPKPDHQESIVAAPPRPMDEILLSTAETMVVIGGYIMLFSILALWIRQLAFLPPYVQALLAGAAEITTGVHQLSITFPPEQALIPVVAATAFGGFSGVFQTKSVIKNAGLSVRHYACWKAVHASLSVLFAMLPLLLRILLC